MTDVRAELDWFLGEVAKCIAENCEKLLDKSKGWTNTYPEPNNFYFFELKKLLKNTYNESVKRFEKLISKEYEMKAFKDMEERTKKEQINAIQTISSIDQDMNSIRNIEIDIKSEPLKKVGRIAKLARNFLNKKRKKLWEDLNISEKTRENIHKRLSKFYEQAEENITQKNNLNLDENYGESDKKCEKKSKKQKKQVVDDGKSKVKKEKTSKKERTSDKKPKLLSKTILGKIEEDKFVPNEEKISEDK